MRHETSHPSCNNAWLVAGSLFQTASGAEGILTSVVVGTPYVDPGASAKDERSAEPGVYTDVSHSIVVSGVSEVDTATPTPPNAPFAIT